jgi:hypothetical protein
MLTRMFHKIAYDLSTFLLHAAFASMGSWTTAYLFHKHYLQHKILRQDDVILSNVQVSKSTMDLAIWI